MPRPLGAARAFSSTPEKAVEKEDVQDIPEEPTTEAARWTSLGVRDGGWARGVATNSDLRGCAR